MTDNLAHIQCWLKIHLCLFSVYFLFYCAHALSLKLCTLYSTQFLLGLHYDYIPVYSISKDLKHWMLPIISKAMI